MSITRPSDIPDLGTPEPPPEQHVTLVENDLPVIGHGPSLTDYSDEREAMGSEDVALPFLTIIQDLSPQRKSSAPEYNPAAISGDIINTVTQELFKKVVIIPCRYQRRYVEWKPRAQGGGLVRDWGSDSTGYDAAQETDVGTRLTRGGNEISAQATYFALQLIDGHASRVIMSMTSTQWRTARRWNSVVQNFELTNARGQSVPAPVFARTFEFTTILQRNASGEWYGWAFKPLQLISELKDYAHVLRIALDFRQAVTDGTVRVQPPADVNADGIPF